MMEKKRSEYPKLIKNDEIDLVAVIKLIKKEQKTIYYSIGLFVCIGLLIAFISPVKYSVTATLLPSSEKSKGTMGGLSALAGMAGVNLGSMVGESTTIPAEIYPQVVNSYPFLNELIHQEFNFNEFKQPISVYNYLLNDTIESIWTKIANYTFRLPWTIKDAILSRGEIKKNVNKELGLIILTEKEEKVYNEVKELITVEVDDETGIVSLTCQAEEPILTAQYVHKSLELLQKYVIDYKTKQAREKLKFIHQSYIEKKLGYEKLQKEFFEYKDRHRNIISERTNPEFQRLSDEYDLVSTVYEELAKQLEQAKIAVKEETPAFTIIQPVRVPIEKSSPKRGLIMMSCIVIGGILGLLIILGRNYFKSFNGKLYV